MATRRRSSKVIWMRSGWSSGSICWVLLAWGRFPVSKAIIPDGQEHFLTPSAHRDTHIFGGLGLSENQQILVNQCLKRGIHIIPVPAPGTSQTCPRCGHRHRENRESQASFRCQHCGWAGHADHSAAQVIRNRGFVRITEFIHGSTPCVQDAPTGWQEQPSRYGQLALLPVAQNTLKPKSSATKPCRSSRKPPGSAAPGRTSQVLGTTKSSAGAMLPPDSSDQSLETGLAQGVQTRLP